MSNEPKNKPGRPPQIDKAKIIPVRMSPADIAAAKALGDGNISAGVREALKQSQND